MVDRDRQFCYSRASTARGPGHFCLALHVAMQLGLYLPGLAALSGVQSLRILDGYELPPAHFPEPPRSVHGERELEEPAEAGISAVVAESKLSHDERELFEVHVLRRENGVPFEEWDHVVEQVAALRTTSTSARSRRLFGLMRPQP